MKYRYINAVCLGIAAIASIGILWSAASANPLTLGMSSFLLEAFPVLLVLGCVGIFAYTLIKFRSRPEIPTHLQHFQLQGISSRSITDSADSGYEDFDRKIENSTTERNTAKLTSANIEVEIGNHQHSQGPVHSPQINSQSSNISSMGSSGIQVEYGNLNTMLDVDDLEFESIEIENPFVDDPDQPEPEPEFEIADNEGVIRSLDPITEAKVLVFYGKSSQAIELLLENFSLSYAKHDEIALELVSILESEIVKEGISSERLAFLSSQRFEVISMLRKDKRKLSREAWSSINWYFESNIAQSANSQQKSNFG